MRPMGMSGIGLGVTLVACGVAAAQSPLEATFNPANNNMYVVLSSAGWGPAEAVAIELGGNLATINDAAENEFVRTFAGATGSSSVWIGYNDLAEEGTFVWSSGQPNGFEGWTGGGPSEPDLFENCVEVFASTGSWNDQGCSDDRRGMVEIEFDSAVGACTIVDACSLMTGPDCAAGGSYAGDFTFCIGACCLIDGTCMTMTEIECFNAGGNYSDALDCATADCMSRVVVEAELNGFASAQSLDGQFSTDADRNIEGASVIPHATVVGSGDDSFDFYTFTGMAGQVVMLDIDAATTDLAIGLFDPAGNPISGCNDAQPEDGAAGSDSGQDPFLRLVLNTSGVFTVGVSTDAPGPVNGGFTAGAEVPAGSTYVLHVSVGRRLM